MTAVLLTFSPKELFKQLHGGPSPKGTLRKDWAPPGLVVGGCRVSGQLQDSAAYIWSPWLPENYLGGLRGRCSGSGGGAWRPRRG